jgi:hypothetical protein
VYLRRTALHLYYTFDDDDVIVRALWEHIEGTASDLIRQTRQKSVCMAGINAWDLDGH